MYVLASEIFKIVREMREGDLIIIDFAYCFAVRHVVKSVEFDIVQNFV